jgi:hypothetical protein
VDVVADLAGFQRLDRAQQIAAEACIVPFFAIM